MLTIALIVALVIVVPNLVGFKTLTVLSGSMAPKYPTGSMVFVKETEPEQIQVGDVVSYVLNERGTISTHRVVEHDSENRIFITKGDANDSNDPKPLVYENVVGVVKFSIPLLGYILSFVLTTQGKIIAGTILVALIILLFIQEDPEKTSTGEAPKNRQSRRKSKKSAQLQNEAPPQAAPMTAEQTASPAPAPAVAPAAAAEPAPAAPPIAPAPQEAGITEVQAAPPAQQAEPAASPAPVAPVPSPAAVAAPAQAPAAVATPVQTAAPTPPAVQQPAAQKAAGNKKRAAYSRENRYVPKYPQNK